MPTIYNVIRGGFGNQLFQSAMSFVLQQKSGADVKYSTFTYEKDPFGRTFLLQNLPRALRPVVPMSDISGLPFYQEPDDNSDPQGIMNTMLDQLNRHGSLVMSGNWQNEAFFLDYRPQIKEMFQMEISDELRQMGDILHAKASVALHVRRYDFGHHGLAALDYYRNAIADIRRERGNVPVVVFTDEYNYSSYVFKDLENCLVMRGNTDNPLSDFYLMSRCVNFIIANSTFSWWAAWLGEREDSIVYVPQPWCLIESSNPASPRWRRVLGAVRTP